MTDDKIKQYFLGKLDETESFDLEIEISQNEELNDQAKLVETELIEAYLSAGLSASERNLFENNYLTTEARYQKVNSAGIFLAGIKNIENLSDEKVSFWQKFSAFIQPRFAIAGLILLIFIGGLVFVFINFKKTEEVAEVKTPTPTPQIEIKNTPIAENLQNSEIKNTNSQIIKESKSPTPTPQTVKTPNERNTESKPPVLATFTLSPGTFRSEGEQTIKLSANTKRINLRLNLPKDSGTFQTYKAILKTADGETVSTFSNLKNLSLTLPADKLENRTYIIFLEGNTTAKSAESLTEYTFRVIPQK